MSSWSKVECKEMQVFKREVNYLGQVVSSDSYRLDPSIVEPIVSLKHSWPATVGEVRKTTWTFGLLLTVYRKFLCY